jgi:hypothetical protein
MQMDGTAAMLAGGCSCHGLVRSSTASVLIRRASKVRERGERQGARVSLQHIVNKVDGCAEPTLS